MDETLFLYVITLLLADIVDQVSPALKHQMADPFGTHAIYSADELMILRALKPAFMPTEDQDVLADHARSNQAYEEALRTGLESLSGVVPDPRYVGTVNSVRDPAVERAIYGADSDDEEEGPDGGFAFAALAPILGAIAPSLINSGFKLLSRLFKKRGAGVMPPNARGVMPPNARGVRPPNIFTKGGRKAFIASIAPRLYQEEDMVRELRGKRFWHELLKMGRKYLREAVGQAGMNKKGVDVVLNKLLPLSFQKFVAKVGRRASDVGQRAADITEEVGRRVSEAAAPIEGEATGEGKGVKNEMNQLRSIIRTVCEWVIHEATDGKLDPAKVRPLIDKHLMKLDKKTLKIQGGSKAGWNNFWSKVKKFASKVGKAVLPGLAEIGKKGAPALIKTILSGITVSDKNKKWLDLANTLADSAGSLIPAPSTGSGFVPDYMNPPPGKPSKKPMDADAKAALVARLQEGKRRAAARRAAEQPESFVSGMPAPPPHGGKKAVTLRF